MDYQYFFTSEITVKAIPKTKIMVAPEAKLKIYESSKPTTVKIAPIIMENSINFLIL